MWNIISASSIGSGHILNNMPCQDSYSFKLIDDNCGIAIIADGAGSCKYSDIGSKFVTDKGIELFAELILKHNWNNSLPDNKLWREKAINITKNIADLLNEFAISNNYEYKYLSSTFIILLFSKDGICSLNIGDGRGAIKNSNNKWCSIVNPYHGEQVGMTVFLTSNIWGNQDTYISTVVKNEKIKAFIILSDGYEKITFECYTKGNDDKYYDPNRPFEKFLDFKYEVINKLLENTNIEDINTQWEEFLKNGNEILKNETDDKTMVFGIFSN
jgi:hypothetical protein